MRPLANVGAGRAAQVRGDICSFLEYYIYESIAETLPDFRDEMGGSAEVRLAVDDPYLQEMSSQKRTVNEMLEEVDLRARAKPRKRKGQVNINLSRTSVTMEERWLPPGTMREYYEQYRAQSGLEKPGSFPSFWRVAGTVDFFFESLSSNFGSQASAEFIVIFFACTFGFCKAWLSEFGFMQIRASTQHAQCSTCVRHRHLIKFLGCHLHARQQQQDYYWQHLRDQYLDRLQYYRYRSLSRQRDGRFICIIQDGLDQAKVSLPRSSWMYSKEFSAFKAHRPKLHLTLTLVHGFFLLFTLSLPDTMKDSNASLETICYALHLLQTKHGVHLPGCSLSIQADNACREIKNNPFFRWAALQTSSGNLKNVSVRFLRSGHSHEDVDQIFGRLAMHYSKLSKAETPQDFEDSTRLFARDVLRPHELGRYVVTMAQTRDWSLIFLS